MAAVASAEVERRGSSFLDAARDIDDADGTAAEWAAMSSGERVQFNDGPPTEEEAAKLITLRKNLHDLVATPPLKDQPENVSEFKMLRFLRGYAGDVAAAEKAYRNMADFRGKQGLDKLREKLLAKDCQSPHLLKEFAPIIDCVSRGVRHHYGMDTYGNLLTMTDIGALDLRAIIKGGLEELYTRFCLMTEEHGNILLHKLSCKAGKLVARHDVINVVNFGFFQWNKACYDLLTPIFEGGKHYPESVRKITSCGNGSVAVAAWQIMKHFIPDRTKRKLRVLGTSFVPDLLTEIPLQCIPLVWGGAGFGSAFDEAWTQTTERMDGDPNTYTIGRRDRVEVKVGVPAGSVVSLAMSLQGYTLSVSTWFSAVQVHDSSAVSAVTAVRGRGGETKASNNNDNDNVCDADLAFDVVTPPKIIKSAAGRVEIDPWVAPTRGIFKVTLDNTFSMFRAKSVKVWLVVEKDGLEDETCEDGDDENAISF